VSERASGSSAPPNPTAALRRAAELVPRPLDPIRSIKVKISILLLVSGGAGLAYLWSSTAGSPRSARSRSPC
jgi:hypothetical protein